jgi:exodeoxyribonuclease VII large subunit
MVEFGVSDFIAVFNQTVEVTYPDVIIVGELANFRVSHNKWVYFDLKDETASLKCFGSIYVLRGPLEDGMLLKVQGRPQLHNLYNFALIVKSLQASGEGSLRRAAELLKQKLAVEGLFDETRKRPLVYPPDHIGLITAKDSAAFSDFIKVIRARWEGLIIDYIDVSVQGEAAPAQIVSAIEHFNFLSSLVDVLVIIRGGGSPEELAAFNNESVTRAVAGSRIPTLVAIGHERDVSLAELAADRRASTPSNAAELLVPDRHDIRQVVVDSERLMRHRLSSTLATAQVEVRQQTLLIDRYIFQWLKDRRSEITHTQQVLEAFNPLSVLKRGYAIVRHNDQTVRRSSQIKPGVMIDVQLAEGGFSAAVEKVK